MSQSTAQQKNTMNHTNFQIIAPPRDTGKPYKRTPAPESLTWIPGKEDFEDFHDRLTAFIGQQNQMQYILEDKFQSIYLQFGNNKHMTLGLANAANVHPTVKYISVEQFENDIPYLYNALKHSIRG